MSGRIWRVGHVSAGDMTIKDASPYPTFKDALAQAGYLLSGGAKDVWIIDSDGTRSSKTEIEALLSN